MNAPLPLEPLPATPPTGPQPGLPWPSRATPPSYHSRGHDGAH